jgi:Sulfatase/RTX calcium-binding nonapeptide repeat (4 copies)
VSDKPPWIQAVPRFSAKLRADGDHYRRTQLQSLRAVDDAVAGILAALEETGRLGDTLVVFTSDNGFPWGEHRWWRKRVPYEEVLRVPMVIRYDPLTRARARLEHFALNIDLAPTMADLAGVDAPGVDGRSLLPLLAGGGGLAWRRDFLVESGELPVAPYCGVRTSRLIYTQYASGHEELYDLVRDPYQLENSADRPQHRRTLVGRRARVAELCSPPPPGLLVRSTCLPAGTPADDRLRGSRYFDNACGAGGEDRIRVRRGSDRADGGRGSDVVDGGRGNDRLTGGRGRDRILGGPGHDRISTADGFRDVVSCGRGRDRAVVDGRDRALGDCEHVRPVRSNLT